MDKVHSVIIDGIEYRPVDEMLVELPSAELVMRKLVEVFWGTIPEHRLLTDEARSLYISITDDRTWVGIPTVLDFVTELFADNSE